MRLILSIFILLVLALPVCAEEMNVGGHFQDFEEYRKVIDARCIICHTGERVEEARAEGRELEPIQSRMVEHGAVLSEREKEVLGTFWGMPLKGRGTIPGPPSPAPGK